jgi:hypothetical protein
MVDVYTTEAERRAALDEVTRLRREFDTTTAKGAKAFGASPEAQAALARLDAAKSAAGMRTSAEDLAALNQFATSDLPTSEQTPAERKDVRQGLNQPSRQYFKQVQEAYKNPDVVPTWQPNQQVTPDLVQQYAGYGVDASKARYDWVLVEDSKTGQSRWGVGLIGLIQQKPADLNTATPLDVFYSDTAPIAEARTVKGVPSWNSTWNQINLDELEQALPDITYSELQEIYYQLTLERDTDITIEDILDKYDDMFRGN